jgi:hypothetical protein
MITALAVKESASAANASTIASPYDGAWFGEHCNLASHRRKRE